MQVRLLMLVLLSLWGCAGPASTPALEVGSELAQLPVTEPDAGLASPEGQEGPEEIEEAAEQAAPDALDTKWPPGPKAGDKNDWICLKSGEWLRGEFISLSRGSAEFESDELDRLNLDWDDVHEVVTNRNFTVVLGDRTQIVGYPRVTREQLFVTNRFGVFEYPRARMMRMIPGQLDKHAFWTGRFGMNATVREGNTNQTDLGITGTAKRRTARGRTSFSLDTLVSTTDNSETANYRSFSARHDLYLAPRFFLTPLGLDLYSDRFQNIDLRLTPSTGVGYTLVDNGKLEWDGTASLGYRYTRFDSVAMGEDDSDGSATLILGTQMDADLTSKLEVILDYRVEVGLEDVENTNHDLGVTLSVDFLWGLDLDVRLSWKQVGVPEPDANGITPDPDDYRVDIGFSWEF